MAQAPPYGTGYDYGKGQTNYGYDQNPPPSYASTNPGKFDKISFKFLIELYLFDFFTSDLLLNTNTVIIKHRNTFPLVFYCPLPGSDMLIGMKQSVHP